VSAPAWSVAERRDVREALRRAFGAGIAHLCATPGQACVAHGFGGLGGHHCAIVVRFNVAQDTWVWEAMETLAAHGVSYAEAMHGLSRPQ
jgi:hypothetical protein